MVNNVWRVSRSVRYMERVLYQLLQVTMNSKTEGLFTMLACEGKLDICDTVSKRVTVKSLYDSKKC